MTPNPSKRFQNMTLQSDKVYELAEGIEVMQSCATAKFDETVEIAVNLGVDSKKSTQMVRGLVHLPHGRGKTLKIAVFAQGDSAQEAKTSNADAVGAEDLVKKMEKGDCDYDVVIATPDCMSIVGKLGKILGPKGLMPNPKDGTVTTSVNATIEALKKGQVTFKMDKGGVVHCPVGKASFTKEHLVSNIRAFLSAVLQEKPSSVKRQYMKDVILSSTMGPGIRLKATNLAVLAP